ncbi:MAG: hypothetical protein E7055_04135 [Lentisphaerae bacterium]|nr:hypothetical protein [Lentisphaerota bacterium]
MSEILIWVLVLSFLIFGVISYLCKVSRFLLKLLEAAILLAIIGCLIHFLMSEEKKSTLKNVEKKVINRINNVKLEKSSNDALPAESKVDKNQSAPMAKQELVKTPPSQAPMPKQEIVKTPPSQAPAAEKVSEKTSGKDTVNPAVPPSRPAQPAEKQAQPVPSGKENQPESVNPGKKPEKKKQTLFDEIENMSFDI